MFIFQHCKWPAQGTSIVPIGTLSFPMQLVVQYLTQAAIKLPSASDNTRGGVQRPLLSGRYCPWCTGKDRVTGKRLWIREELAEFGMAYSCC